MAQPAVASHWPPARTPPTPPTVGPTLPLRGTTLLVRSLQRADLDRRQAWPPYSDPLHLIWDMPRYSARENDGWFAQMNDGRHRLSYAVDDAAGQMIGMISLREINWGHSARLGISLNSRYAGRGLGTATMQLFFPYYFLTLRFDQMLLDVAAANLRAVRCYEKLAFRKAATRWLSVDGALPPHLFDQPDLATLRGFFRWFADQVETMYLDMELRRREWAEGRSHP